MELERDLLGHVNSYGGSCNETVIAMSTSDEQIPVAVRATRVLIDAHKPVLDNGAVLVQGQHIVAVGNAEEVTGLWDGPIRRLDLGDVTLLPGMIDCHVHLGYESVQSRAHAMSTSVAEPELVALMLYNAGQLLHYGVTTIRELGSLGRLGSVVRDIIARGWAKGPRVLAANEPLTTSGGHAWFLGGECDSAEEINKAVRNHHKLGADLIKMMVTGGGLTSGSVPWRAQFSAEEVDLAVREATRLGMPVAAHVHGTEGIAIAARSGITTLEHCTWMGEGGKIGHDVDPEILQEIVTRDIFVCPTASSRWEMMESKRRAAKIETVARMHEAGIRLIAGTDAGIEHVPHSDYAQGLEWLHRCGLSTQEVIASATTLAAEACGVADIAGSLEVGKSADMIAVRGNPLKSLDVLKEPLWVMARGESLPGLDLVPTISSK